MWVWYVLMHLENGILSDIGTCLAPILHGSSRLVLDLDTSVLVMGFQPLLFTTVLRVVGGTVTSSMKCE